MRYDKPDTRKVGHDTPETRKVAHDTFPVTRKVGYDARLMTHTTPTS